MKFEFYNKDVQIMLKKLGYDWNLDVITLNNKDIVRTLQTTTENEKFDSNNKLLVCKVYDSEKNILDDKFSYVTVEANDLNFFVGEVITDIDLNEGDSFDARGNKLKAHAVVTYYNDTWQKFLASSYGRDYIRPTKEKMLRTRNVLRTNLIEERNKLDEINSLLEKLKLQSLKYEVIHSNDKRIKLKKAIYNVNNKKDSVLIKMKEQLQFIEYSKAKEDLFNQNIIESLENKDLEK